MNDTKQTEKGGKRPPVRLLLSATARQKLSRAGIYCQPRVSLAYQKAAKRYVLRGIESGGAVREFGHYVVFCDGDGKGLAWLQPVQSITANGPHAVIIAASLVSVEVFRVVHTYELLIARHEACAGQEDKAPFVFSEPVFSGRQGYLSLELWGRDKDVAGEIAPEFFSHGGERHDIPARFLAAARAATQGASRIGCEKAQFARAPETVQPSVAETVPEPAPLLQVVAG